MNYVQNRWFVASVCVSIVLALQTAIVGYVIPTAGAQQWATYIGLVFSGIGIYAIIFKTATLLYDHIVWKLLYPNLFIHGDWSHELVEPDGKVRSGTTEIRQTAYAIEICGVNFADGAGTDIRSIWTSTSVWFAGRKLYFAFEGNRTDGEQTIKTGLVVAQLVGSPKPTMITGMYYDTNPSKGIGKVTWRRELNAASKSPNNPMDTKRGTDRINF